MLKSQWVLNIGLAGLVLFFLAGAPHVERSSEPPPMSANSFNLSLVVNNNAVDAPDGNPGDQVCETAVSNGICTLRAAIMEANAFAGLDEITIPAGTFTLTRVGYDDNAVNGDLDITDDLYIHGLSESQTFIDGNGAAVHGRVFHIGAGVTVLMTDLTVEDGLGQLSTAESQGGGIYNEGDLTLFAVHVYQNQAPDAGGIANDGKLVIQNSSIEDNSATSSSGGILNGDSGILEIGNSLITLNDAGSAGGGIYAGGMMTVTQTTISYNTAFSGGGIQGNNALSLLVTGSSIFENDVTDYGGGVYSWDSNLRIYNTTISANSSDFTGGGLYSFTNVRPGTVLYNVTVANNRADDDDNNTGNAGGIKNYGGALTISNSLSANNRIFNLVGGSTPDDCYGTVNSLGYNLVETDSATCTIVGILTGNITGQDPILASLANDGGLTMTHALQTGSPAIDAGNPAGCLDEVGSALPFDQRGYLRHFDGGIGTPRCDIGAFEYLAPDAFYIWMPILIK